MKWLTRYLPNNISKGIGSFTGLMKDAGHGVLNIARFITSDTGKRLGGSLVSSLGKLGVLNKAEVASGRNLLKDVQQKADTVQRIGKTVDEFASQIEGGNKNVAKPQTGSVLKLMPVRNKVYENNLLGNLDFQQK